MSIRNTIAGALVVAGISLAAGCATQAESETEEAAEVVEEAAAEAVAEPSADVVEEGAAEAVAEAAPEMPEMTPEQMMEAYAKVNALNENHARLAKMAGTWSVAGKSWMEPGKPPMETQGTSTFTLLLGGRYLKQEYSAEFMGMAYTGVGIEGYDNAKGKHFSTWFDNMSTGTMVSWGDYDAEAKRLTLHSDYLDPVLDMTQKLKLTADYKTDDEVVFTMYMMMPDGSEMKHMELTYTRKK